MLKPPIEPMLAKLAAELPEGEGWLFEPKWDGFRAIVFRDGDDLYIQSRDSKPLDRYFPELAAVLLQNLPARCVVDGEIVIASDRGLDFACEIVGAAEPDLGSAYAVGLLELHASLGLGEPMATPPPSAVIDQPICWLRCPPRSTWRIVPSKPKT